MESLDRINSRKIERLLLQHRCKQYLGTTADTNMLKDISENDKALYQELSLKRSTTFKDPSKSNTEKRNSWEAFNQLPTKELRKLILPNIVRMDQRAVSHIKDKIKNEEFINDMQRMWIQEHRQELRNKLKQRHNNQIELLKKSGLKTPFREIGDIKFQSYGGKIKGNNRISMMDDSTTEIERILDEHHNSIISQKLTKIDEEKIISQRGDLESSLRLISENKRYNSQIDRPESCFASIKKDSIDSDIKENIKNLEKLDKLDKIEFNLTPVKKFDDKFPNTNRSPFIEDTFNRLYDIKKFKDISSPYLATDFRGLLISDYDEALNNCDTGNYKTLTTFNKEDLGSTRFRIGKRKSNATKELFPTPYDLSKFNIQNAKKRKSVKIGGVLNTSSNFYNPKAT